ncbi:autotransporter outer membrane beta-barrel domain-containing protein [Pantoea sp. MBD-2R]|uniref:autotransporter outer membrane beta-barrel domain-containing protein n=1 Tax=Pantoea sp. MBD-2R TaxID=3141540 RepID=UPI003183517D
MAMEAKYFSLNLLTLALFPLCSYAASPWSVTDGSTYQVTESYSSREKDDFPLNATGTGSTLITDPGLTFTTVDSGTFAAKLRDGSSLELNDATLTTAGGSAHGVDMENATLTINTGRFTISGANSAAIMATNSDLILNDVSAQLDGNLTQGIRLNGGSLKASDLTLSATEKTNRVISLFSVSGTLNDVNITQQAASSDNALFLDSSTLTASNITINAATTAKAAIKVGNGTGNDNTTRSSLTLEDSTINTGFVGLRAMNGDMTLTNVNVHTTLASGYALDINSQSNTILEGGSYLTEGTGAAGANLANATTTLNATNSRFTTSGSEAHAIQVQAGTATLTDSVLTTSGAEAYGAFTATSGQLTLTDSTINTSGDAGHGIVSGGNVSGENLTLTTSGAEAYGAFTATSGQLTLTDSTINTSGDAGHGIVSGGNVSGENLTLTTSGTEAYGAWAVDGGQLTLNDSTITTTGVTSFGLAARNGTLTVTDTDIETSASNGRGVYIKKTSSLDLKNSTITTSGELAHGLYADSSSAATLANISLSTAGDAAYGMVIANSTVESSNDTISTQGEGSAGIYAAASTVTASNLTLNTSGTDAHALIASLSTMKLTDSTVTTTGNAVGLNVLNSADNQQSTITLDNVALRSEASTGVLVKGAALDLGLSNGTLVYGGDGVALSIQPTTSSEGAITYSQADVTADNNVTLLGDVIADSYDSTLNLSLSNSSTLNGATQNVNQLILDNTSSWLITGDSNVNNLLQNKGTAIFTDDSGFSTLTIDGDLTGSGQFVMNTQLGDDSSATDRIQVNGSASGDYVLTVNNKGGLGAATSAGILLVDVAGDAQAATFNLRNNSVVAGNYEYFLNNINDNSWYLQASYTPVDPVTPATPADTADPAIPADTAEPITPADPAETTEPDSPTIPTAPGPVTYRAETAGYLIAPYLNSAYGFATIGSWHERVGATQKDRTAWGRVYGRHDNYQAGRFAFDVNTAFVQLGGDLLKKDLAESWHVTAGPMITLGHQTSSNKDTARSARAGLSVDVGKIETNAYGIGAYLTFWDDSGAYLDNVAQLTRYSNNFSSQTNAKMDSYATVLSMEVGKPFTLVDKLKLEPQLQAMGQYMNISQTYSSGVKLKDQNLMMAQLREGIRLVYDGENIKPYIQGDVVQMLGHTPGIDMNNETLRPDVRRGFWQASAGVSASLNPRFSVYSQVKYSHSFGPGSEGYTGNLGLKYQF